MATRAELAVEARYHRLLAAVRAAAGQMDAMSRATAFSAGHQQRIGERRSAEAMTAYQQGVMASLHALQTELAKVEVQA